MTREEELKEQFSNMDIQELEKIIKNGENVYTDEIYNLALQCYELRSSESKQGNFKKMLVEFVNKYKKELILVASTTLVTFLLYFGLTAKDTSVLPSNQSTPKASATLSKPNNNLPSLSNSSESLPPLSVSYVGSKNSDKYHKPNCKWAKKIKSSNKITFTSSTNARNKGYSPCKTCID